MRTSIPISCLLTMFKCPFCEGPDRRSGDTRQHASVTAAVQRHCSVCVLSHGRGLVAGLQNTPAAAASVSPTLQKLHTSADITAEHGCSCSAVSPTLQKLHTSAESAEPGHPARLKLAGTLPVCRKYRASQNISLQIYTRVHKQSYSSGNLQLQRMN